MKITIALKQAIHGKCEGYVNERIQTAKSAMEEAQLAANEEVKSSAGDKYETGRAMLQIERDKHAVQLSEALKLKAVLDHIDASKEEEVVKLGTLVSTSMGTFYISISAGKLEVDKQMVFAISMSSPIGAKLNGMKKGEETLFNEKKIKVFELV
ncbi:3-oxoacyl-ACP synthase [Limibacter armeniacum]|uniref:3-oxoacyl-ACP synthase n=1 Tax=Limibacter armeniacum TaxID=466084 RepID=UPI002FE67026